MLIQERLNPHFHLRLRTPMPSISGQSSGFHGTMVPSLIGTIVLFCRRRKSGPAGDSVR